MSVEPASTGASRRLRGLDPAVLMAQGLGPKIPGVPDGSQPVVPGFVLLGRLGAGGMGEVHLARQVSLDREVAIKVVGRDRAAEEWFLERLEREARLLARLNNPHLVTVHDFIRLPDGTAAVVMELVEGGSLRDRLRASPDGLPPEEAISLAEQVGTALAAAHAEGIVHRDVKPENILVDADGRVRVSDFGMALSLTSDAPRLTATGAAAGTPGYLAPEQVEGGAVDERADVYALGVVLYEMLSGRLPLGRFEPVSRLRPGIPAGVDAAVEASLRRDPSGRPGSVLEFLSMLRRPGRASMEPPRVSRRTLLAGGVGLASVAAVGGWLRHGRGALGAAGTEVGRRWVAPWPEDLGRATVSGSWRRDGEALVSGDGVCILAISDKLPPVCDLVLTLQRLGGSESAAVFFRHPSGFGSVELDGWTKHRSGLQSVDGSTTAGEDGFEFALLPGREHRLSLGIRPEGVVVGVDGQPRRRYPLLGRQLTVVSPWNWKPAAEEGPALALGSYSSPVRFSRLELAVPGAG